MLYIACVKDVKDEKGAVKERKVIVVGRDRVVALDLLTGKPAWATPPPLPAWPNGRGLFDGENYHLPLASSELWTLDLVKGAVIHKATTESPLGNLVSYRGDLISQTGSQVAVAAMFIEVSFSHDAMSRELRRTT